MKKNNKGNIKRPDFPRGKRPQSVYRGKHYVHKDKQDMIQDPKYKTLDEFEIELERRDIIREATRPYGSDWWSQPLE